MKVIAVMNEKGGAGKSTISIGLACALFRQGERVVLVDSDPQGSARDWRETAGEGADLPPVIGLDKPDSIKDGLKAFSSMDWVVVDTPAKAAKASGVIINAADFVLIPLQPSGLDVWGASAIVNMVGSYKDMGGQVEAGFVPTRIRPGTKLGSEILNGDWNEYGIKQLSSVVCDREAYKKSITDGKSIFETNDGAAKGEIDCLLEEIQTILKGN
ncbi:MAG: cobyrinic acid ac-diamide synthase [Methylotenera sp.]|nr:MAG: cobyrinic acid ac-diamide synthase [Methylotenera sp.]